MTIDDTFGLTTLLKMESNVVSITTSFNRVFTHNSLSISRKTSLCGTDDLSAVYLTDRDGNIVRYHPLTNETIWKANVRGIVQPCCVLSKTGQTLLVLENSVRLVALSTTDGSEIWSFLNSDLSAESESIAE